MPFRTSRIHRLALIAAVWGATCLAAAAGPASASAPLASDPVVLPGPAFPSFETAAQLEAACATGLEGARTRSQALETVKSGGDWLHAWEDLNDWTEDRSGALIFLQNVHPDAAVRAASEACELRWQDFQSTLGLNQKIYRGAVRSRAVLRDPIDRRAVELALESFEDAGVALSPDKRRRAKEISDRLTALGQQFARNIRDAGVHVKFTVDELRGVPEAVWNKAPRDADDHVLLGTDYPVYLPVMQSAENPAARERMWRAKTNEGGAANLKLLAEIVQARRDYAHLFGQASYADFALRRRMAGNPARVTRFLDEVRAAVDAGESRDLADLRDAKARHLGLPVAQVTLQRWDTAFYGERLKREKYDIDEERFRPYFPPQQSLAFVMRLAEKLFGVHYERVPGHYWHDDVQAYAVTDTATGKPLASLYVDLYPREGKYHHAAVWSYRNASTAGNRVAQAALVVNFNRSGLTLEELQTLLHEFGHSLHSNLSATRWASDGGTNVMLDFVEAPSQMLEDWIYDPQVLKVFQEVCPDCKPVPDALVAQAKAAKDFEKGLFTARQHLYATYDLALHGAAASDPLATWEKMEGATPLGHVPGTIFPAGFGHIASGYGAGYYSYLWSLVVAMDLRTAFADRLDPAVGARYRRTVLAQGGQKPPDQLIRDFLGRPLSTRAFFDDLKKQ